MNTSLLRLITTASSILWLTGCASSYEHASLPASGVHAPAERLEPISKPYPPVLTQDLGELTSMSLDLLFAYADAHAPALLTAQARVEVSRADQVEASFTFPSNPTLSLGAGARRAQGATGFDYELALSQTFELAGEQSARRHTANLDLEVAQSMVDEVRWLTHVEVHRLAWLWLAVQEQRTRATLLVDFSNSMATITQTQIRAGEVSPLDLLVVKADLARAKAHLVEVIQQESVITTRLAAIIGWPHAMLPPLEGQLPDPRQPLSDENLLIQLATYHPSVRQRELAVEAQRARLILAEREAAPKPSFGVNYARESSPGGPPSASSQAAHIGMLTLSMPLTVWRTNQEGRARAKASLDLAARERTQTMRELQGELQVASAAVTAALAILDLYTSDIIPQLHTHFELLQRAYELGEVDIHQVSQTRERLLDAMTQYTQARVLYFDRAATLEGLVGTEQWGTPLEDHTP